MAIGPGPSGSCGGRAHGDTLRRSSEADSPRGSLLAPLRARAGPWSAASAAGEWRTRTAYGLQSDERTCESNLRHGALFGYVGEYMSTCEAGARRTFSLYTGRAALPAARCQWLCPISFEPNRP